MPRSLRLALIVVTSLVLIVALAASAVLYTSWGRGVMCERIGGAVSKQMAGRLVIGRITSIELPTVTARDVKILSPQGEPVIEVERAKIEFDLKSLLRGDFAWHRAEIERGVVRLHENERGALSIEETFASPPKKPEEKRASEEGDDGSLDLRTMVTSDMVLVISGGKLPTLRLVDLHGVMRVQVPADGPVVLRFDDYRGVFKKGLPTGTLVFRDVKGQVTPDYRRLLHFEGKGEFERESVSFGLDIRHEPKTLVEIRAHFPKLSATSVATLGLDAWSKLSPRLHIDVTHGD